MQIAQDGSPIISTPDDQRKANRFIDMLVDRVYDRLPRFVKMFVSRERLASLLREEVVNLATGL